MISLKNFVTVTILSFKKSFKITMCASFPNRMLLARFWMIFAMTMSPRRTVGSLLGIATSTVSGVTIAGEMNLGYDVRPISEKLGCELTEGR